MAKCQVLLQLLGTDLTRSDRVVKKRQTDGTHRKSGIGRTGLSDGETTAPRCSVCLLYVCNREAQLLPTAEPGYGAITDG